MSQEQVDQETVTDTEKPEKPVLAHDHDHGMTEYELICPICHKPIGHTHHAHPPKEAKPGKTAVARPKRVMPVLKLWKKGFSFFGSEAGSSYRRYGAVAEWVVQKFSLKNQLLLADMGVSPEGYAAVCISVTITLAMILVPLSIILAFLLQTVFPLAIMATVPAVFLTLMYYPTLKLSVRKEAIETELAFLSIYLTMTASAGVPVYTSMKQLVMEPNPLPACTRECLNIVRDAEIFVKDSTASMERFSRKHPSRVFRAWLGGFLHVLRMGGDLVTHLDDAADRALLDLEDKWRRYQARCSSIAVFVTVFFALIPVTLYVFLLVMANPSTIGFVIAFNYILAPIGAAMISTFMEMGRPKPPVSYAQYLRILLLSIPIGVVAGAIVLSFGQPSYIALGFGMIAACIPEAINFEIDNRRETQIEDAIPRFIDDIAENRRVGQSLEQAIVAVAWQGRYGKYLDTIVNTIAWNVGQFKQDVAQAVGLIRLQSWHSRSLLWLLQEAARTGGGTLAIFERLTKFADRYTFIQGGIRRDLRSYQMLFYFVSVIIVIITIFIMNYVLSPQTGIVGTMATAGFLASFVSSPENLATMSGLILQGSVVMSFMLGFMGGKMSRGTFAGGAIHAIISVSIALAALLVMQNVQLFGAPLTAGG